MEGWVSLYRKFINWQWYKDSNIKSVFIHLLLCANHKEDTLRKRVIKRGQLVTSRESLSKSLGLSEQQIRTCLKKLEKTNEISIQRTNKYSVITVLKYDYYQKNFDELSTSKITNKLTNKITNKSTNKNSTNSTSEKIIESIENKEIQENGVEEVTNKKGTTPTSKNSNKSTNTLTDKSTTNNNINNIYNNNLTKLNYIFYLIINDDFEKLMLNFSKNQWSGFKMWLTKLDLNVTNDFMNILSAKKQLEHKIIIITLLKIYKNSYVHYKDKITREDLFHKIDKAQEYMGNAEVMSDEQIAEFMNYYWKCLQNKLDGSDNNAKG